LSRERLKVLVCNDFVFKNNLYFLRIAQNHAQQREALIDTYTAAQHKNPLKRLKTALKHMRQQLHSQQPQNPAT